MRKRGASLKKRFILLVGGICLLVAVLSVAAFLYVSRRVVDGFGASFAVKAAALEKARLLQRLQPDIALARKLADSPLLKKWCSRDEDSEIRSQALAELESFRRLFSGGCYFLAVDATRHYYFNDAADGFRGRELRYTLDPRDPTMAWYFQAMRSPDDFALHVDTSEQLGVTKVWINVAIRDNGRRVGLGGSGIDLTGFVRDMVRSRDPGVDTVLLDHRGFLQGHPNEQYMAYNARMKDEGKRLTLFPLLGGEADRRLLRERMAWLRSGRRPPGAFYLTVEGKRCLAALSWLPEIDWFALVLVDPAQVASLATFAPFLALLAVSLLLLLALVVWQLHRLVLNPLEKLNISTREISAGRYDVCLPLERADEIGELTASFNAMSATVRDYTANLEARVEERTEALQQANQALTASNRQIMDSLEYARLIQSAILPGEALLRTVLSEHFVVWRPRDVVGGDFFFAFPREDGGLLLGLADCTGHGVPGAFMTMTANAVLDHAISSCGAANPAGVLGEVNRRMRALLHQEGEALATDNGLDLALLYVPAGEGPLRFAAGKLDLLVLDPSAGFLAVAGDRQSLGYRSSRPDFPFRNQPVERGAGRTFYLFSDGVLDQAGGAKGYGFGRRRLAECLAGSGAAPLAEQKQRLEEALASYQAGRPQRDDITVLGFRLPRARPESNLRQGADA